ncbi:putative necrosis-inducing factor-domain-containing protein [Podospora fimiseda]|uniref:Necrosis-inducing factor-domain-containing protein n=1 Tax=Podospora fimiseda TaxID=252190 RepID=A0AAN6YK21_9PEZI|nr:putative necrosis-inducing factor-domain-containing protein [Podospora fimiseda]
MTPQTTKSSHDDLVKRVVSETNVKEERRIRHSSSQTLFAQKHQRQKSNNRNKFPTFQLKSQKMQQRTTTTRHCLTIVLLLVLIFSICGTVTIFSIGSSVSFSPPAPTSSTTSTIPPQPPATVDFDSLKFPAKILTTTTHLPNNTIPHDALKRNKNKYCIPSYNITSETSQKASPLIKDCLHLINNISNGGDWSFVSVTQRTLATKDTCAFGVETENVSAGVWIKIGNEDIIDAIEGLIMTQRRGENKIGGKGWTVCPEKTETLGPVVVRWGVYHT